MDVGSRNINGTVRDCIQQAGQGMPNEIIGVDFVQGENVDVVMNGHDLADKYGAEFDLVTCCETLEHDNKFWLTVEAMRKCVKPGGFLLITTPGIHFFRHDYPSDYYRFTDTVFSEIFFEGWEDQFIENFSDPNDPDQQKPNDSVLGYARKPLI